jgi:hypothetical protein
VRHREVGIEERKKTSSASRTSGGQHPVQAGVAELRPAASAWVGADLSP